MNSSQAYGKAGFASQDASPCPASGQTTHGENSPPVSLFRLGHELTGPTSFGAAPGLRSALVDNSGPKPPRREVRNGHQWEEATQCAPPTAPAEGVDPGPSGCRSPSRPSFSEVYRRCVLVPSRAERPTLVAVYRRTAPLPTAPRGE